MLFDPHALIKLSQKELLYGRHIWVSFHHEVEEETLHEGWLVLVAFESVRDRGIELGLLPVVTADEVSVLSHFS